jgi:RimJ/RimL family protein N-acetyltransferase
MPRGCSVADFRLETERLVLRNWAPGDLQRFAEVTNTPAVMRWLGGVADQDGMLALEQRVLTCHARYGHCFWLVERRNDGGYLAGEVLGFCGLKRADAPGSTIAGAVEIGWRLREDAWGKGYAKEAALASLRAAFMRFAAREVFAITVDGNADSRGLMTRLGMRRREDLDYEDPRYEPPLRDTIVYSITSEDWKAAQA